MWSFIVWSICDWPMPMKRIVTEQPSVRVPNRRARYGTSSSRTIGCSSRGGPGKCDDQRAVCFKDKSDGAAGGILQICAACGHARLPAQVGPELVARRVQSLLHALQHVRVFCQRDAREFGQAPRA